MASHGLRNHYHDAGLAGYTIGPRREVTLKIQLDSVWNPNGGPVNVRFGGIGNFEEVKRFLGAFPAESGERFIDTLMDLSCGGKAGHLVCTLALLNGSKTKIACRSVSERDA